MQSSYCPTKYPSSVTAQEDHLAPPTTWPRNGDDIWELLALMHVLLFFWCEWEEDICQDQWILQLVQQSLLHTHRKKSLDKFYSIALNGWFGQKQFMTSGYWPNSRTKQGIFSLMLCQSFCILMCSCVMPWWWPTFRAKNNHQLQYNYKVTWCMSLRIICIYAIKFHEKDFSCVEVINFQMPWN